MASFEDYDEFGNYIGADLDSDDEEEISQNQFVQKPEAPPLEGFDDEPMQGTDENALMEIDGSCSSFYANIYRANPCLQKNPYITLLSSMRTNSTTHLQKMFTVQT